MVAKTTYPDESLSQTQTQTQSINTNQDERKSEVEAFDNTKTGVKGLVDSGISKLPRIFINNHATAPSSSMQPPNRSSSNAAIPIIDLHGTRSKVVEEIKLASEEWGFFQVVNHGIPVSIQEKMLNGVRSFHEQDEEMKKPYYSRDETKKFKYYSTIAPFTAPVADWRDSFSCIFGPDRVDPLHFPEVCRDIILEYTEQVKKLGTVLLELFSESLGLKSDHLKKMECGDAMYVQAHYYPACPEPELAIGTNSHADTDFFTVLLQDNTGGLQVLHHNHWVDVHPLPDALVINVGDLLQLVTNDQFKSVKHRVLTLGVGPRISIACFFRTHLNRPVEKCRLYGPIKELLTQDNPPIYKETTITDYLNSFFGKGLDSLDGTTGLSSLKL
ncbi:hypothetical protein V2J09_006072 [Rumex salicifolius]